MIHEKIMLIDGFPPELGMLLKHMILSHHGQYEFGSPKRPKTIEATVLNYLDDMDSKINGIMTHFNKELDNGARWTAYHRLYDRYYYREHCRPVDVSSPETVQTASVREPDRSAVREASPGERSEPRGSFQNTPFAALKEKNPAKNPSGG
jgi:3'-5' exoribonuclease